jgi:hypothetical protein
MIKKKKEFMSTKSAVQKIVEGILHTQQKHKHNPENKKKNKSH